MSNAVWSLADEGKIIDRVKVESLGCNRRLVYVTIAIMAILIFTGIFVYRYPGRPSQPKAAIIDQLGSSHLTEASCFPNETFIETTKELLYTRFPGVDYYSDNATVDLYKSLPSLSYKLIIWRVHSALDLEDNFTAISTSERYSSKKYQHYSDDQLTLCNITGDPNLYFAITPKFIKECMSGRFEDAVVIFMSCNGLKPEYYKTAEAFRAKGVKVFISWSGWIESADNDHAITLLLHCLINGNNTISEAVNKVPAYLYSYGPSTLGYYPRAEVADYRIPDYRQSNIANSVGFVATSVTFLPRSKLRQAL